MSVHYYREVVFPTAVLQVTETLIAMQKELNNYKRKNPTGKEKWIEERQAILKELFDFVGVSKETFQVLIKDNDQVKQQAFEQGKEAAIKEFQHKEVYGNLRFDSKKDKEQIRALSIIDAFNKYNL